MNVAYDTIELWMVKLVYFIFLYILPLILKKEKAIFRGKLYVWDLL